MNKQIAALQQQRDSIRRRIIDRKQSRRSFGDLQGRLVQATVKQLRAEVRHERQRGK